MAPSTSEFGSPRPTLNGHAQNGDLPASTRAIQIADRLADGRRHGHPQDRESFRHLLNEILESSNQQESEQIAEDDVEISSKLLFVIVKAGLEPPTPPNPFSIIADVNAQLLDSLKAVLITLARCPAVTFSPPPNHPSEGTRCGFFFYWLIPKVLLCSISVDDYQIHETASNIIETCLLAGRQSKVSPAEWEAVPKYLKEFLKDVTKILENNLPEVFEAQCLPGPSTIAEIQTSRPEMKLPERSLQVFVADYSKLVRLAVILLLSTTQVDLSVLKSALPTKSVSFAQTWSYPAILQVWVTLLQPEARDQIDEKTRWTSGLLLMTATSSFLVALSSHKAISALICRVAELVSQFLASCILEPSPIGTAFLEDVLCANILRLVQSGSVSSSILAILEENLLPSLLSLKQGPVRMGSVGLDLQHTVELAINIILTKSQAGTESPTDFQIPPFRNSQLSALCEGFLPNSQQKHYPDQIIRPLKRVRISGPEKAPDTLTPRAVLIQKLYGMLGVKDRSDVAGLREASAKRLLGLEEALQSRFVSELGLLACSSGGTLISMTENEDSPYVCSTCDGVAIEDTKPSGDKADELDDVLKVLESIIEAPKFQRLRQPRVAAAMSLCRILRHASSESALDLSASKTNQWCLNALQSSVRELRIAAGRAMPFLLAGRVPEKVRSKNRLIALDFMRNLSDRSDLGLQETCILAWSQLARRLNEGDEMNLVLLKLVEYLGHSNALVSSLAFDELQRLCNHSPYTATRLFTPYWRTVAVTAVQNIQRRPQIIQQLADLLGMSVSDLLVQTQVHTVPFFVLTKRQDALQRIAEACNQSTMALCQEHQNLAAILSNILLQPSADSESLVMALLNSVSPDFKNVDCAELLKSEPQASAAELLKFAGEGEETRTSQAHQALHFLANITHKSSSGRSSSRKTDMTGLFFENHVLGIMALLADTINDGKGPQPIIEKRRCVGAVREMIKLAKGYVSNALPQISACLRTAISNPELSDQASATWIVMIDTLGEDDVAGLVDTTFALVIQYWNLFSFSTQDQIQDMISRLLKSRGPMIREIVHTLPSLAEIPLMSKFEEELGRLKSQMDVRHHFQAFSQRCQSENGGVVTRALNELIEYLQQNQDWLHETASNEHPDPIVAQLTRAILDTSVLFSEASSDIPALCAKSLGLIGCLDYTKIEAVQDKRDILVLSNFDDHEETRDFIVFFLREVLVKSFLCATNSRSQGFLAYAMQELLSIADFQSSVGVRARDGPFDANYKRWVSLPESMRTLLTPFLNSKYFVTAGVPQQPCKYPLFRTDLTHRQWLRTFVFDLLKREVGNDHVRTLFAVLSRIIRSQETAISEFLLPFAVLNVVIHGSDPEKLDVEMEIKAILNQPLSETASVQDALVSCSQTIFRTLDYLSRWMQEKKKELANGRNNGSRGQRAMSEQHEKTCKLQISIVEALLARIPADVISRRAVDCKSFARALFHWEQYIRQEKQKLLQQPEEEAHKSHTAQYARLQDIYAQIDEPDGIEGISAHLQVLDINQQILEHRRAGRWTAAQSWYEMSLVEEPDNADLQYQLLTCLKESGQFETVLKQVESFAASQNAATSSWASFAAEAAWVMGKWDRLRAYVEPSYQEQGPNFNVEIGRALLGLHDENNTRPVEILDGLHKMTATSLSQSSVSSMQSCHDSMLKFHAIAELEAIRNIALVAGAEKPQALSSLDKRLDVLGPFPADKQYLLGLRRAAMQRFNDVYSKSDIASAWLASAKLARKANSTHQAFDAVLHASHLEKGSALIEHSRLLWLQGNHRNAIRSLEGAIATNAFRSHDYIETNESLPTRSESNPSNLRNLIRAKAHLLLAKWVDRAGQTQSDAIIHEYKKAIQFQNRWEKGHYYLGKHYNKLLESEKAKPSPKQAQTYITGEMGKLVVENYCRAMAFGTKYIYQTVPRVLTLWLDLGAETENPLDPQYGNDDNFRAHVTAQRRKMLGACNSQIKKYMGRLPAFVFYTAFSQIVARICHPNQSVYNVLIDIVARVVISHHPQALWALLTMVKSSSRDRAHRGAACLSRIYESSRKDKNQNLGQELKTFVAQSQKLSDQLLHVCEGDIQGKASNISLSKDLGFNHKTAVCRLAVPFESSLTASLPTATDNVDMKNHKAFNTNDYVHISSFLDDVLVLNSLQRPRRISIRGSDGRIYALLCKPKDDLRKDQRLMEFNNMINRALKKDAESSKRRLYIKTYAVTPLNEECGLIEWVDNLKTLREILLHNYKQKNVSINYTELRSLLNESISAPNRLPIFTEKVLGHFPAVFHEWFVEMFPEPGAWLTARLRYTRSCAVMSMVGHVLGLGDRHGENILFEEGNGGTLHVDFNCLFDKGLTFEKPELVPFRLTHNMVDAFGAQGHEGPYRKSCELALGILRGNEDTLMTILETFLYDPTTDFIGKKKKINPTVPDTPEGVLENVRNKVRGLLPGESVPLSVEGYTDELIKQARDPWRLANMYIGWCAFF